MLAATPGMGETIRSHGGWEISVADQFLQKLGSEPDGPTRPADFLISYHGACRYGRHADRELIAIQSLREVEQGHAISLAHFSFAGRSQDSRHPM
jgi:hypothetical protein